MCYRENLSLNNTAPLWRLFPRHSRIVACTLISATLIQVSFLKSLASSHDERWDAKGRRSCFRRSKFQKIIDDQVIHDTPDPYLRVPRGATVELACEILGLPEPLPGQKERNNTATASDFMPPSAALPVQFIRPPTQMVNAAGETVVSHWQYP